MKTQQNHLIIISYHICVYRRHKHLHITYFGIFPFHKDKIHRYAWYNSSVITENSVRSANLLLQILKAIQKYSQNSKKKKFMTCKPQLIENLSSKADVL